MIPGRVLSGGVGDAARIRELPLSRLRHITYVSTERETERAGQAMDGEFHNSSSITQHLLDDRVSEFASYRRDAGRWRTRVGGYNAGALLPELRVTA